MSELFELKVFARLLLAAAILMCGCTWEFSRPAAVPVGATQVNFSKSGGWVYCWLDREASANRCRFWNQSGDRLYTFGHDDDEDDVFVRYEGSGPVEEPELLIDVGRTQIGQAWLKSGVVLIPRNDFTVQKNDVDRLMGAIRAAAERDRDVAPP